MTRQVCGTPSPNSRAGTHTPAGHSHTVLCEENHRGFLTINTQLTHNSQAFLPPASLAYTAHKFFSQRPQVQRWQPPSLSKHKAPPGERQSHSSKVLYKKTNTPENVTTPSPAVKLLKMLWNALQRRQIRGLDDSRVTRAFHCTVPRLPQKHLHTAAFWEPKPLQSMACYVRAQGGSDCLHCSILLCSPTTWFTSSASAEVLLSPGLRLKARDLQVSSLNNNNVFKRQHIFESHRKPFHAQAEKLCTQKTRVSERRLFFHT